MAEKGVCVVVGTGPGIGQAVAARFGREGYALGLIARRKDALGGFVDRLVAENINARAFPADAESANSLIDALKGVEYDLGAIDVLIYNAAVLKPGGPLDVGIEQLVREFRVNVGGALMCAQHVAIGMKNRKRGTLLFTGGGLALSPWAQMASLSIGKSGIRSLANTLHQDLKADGIRVGTVTVDGFVKPGAGALDPAAIAEQYWQLHEEAADAPFERVVR